MAFAPTSFFPATGSDADLPSGDTADIVVTDATTNATTNVQTITHRTSGTAAAGIGTGIVIAAEDAGGSDQNVAIVRSVLTTATAAAEVGAVRVAIVNAGTVPAEGSEQITFGAGGTLTLKGTGGSDPALYFNSTNAYIAEGGGYVAIGVDGAEAFRVDNSAPAHFSLRDIQFNGSLSSGGNLTLSSTNHATKGKIYLGSAQTSYFDEASPSLVINGSAVGSGADVTWEQKYTTRGVAKAALTAGQVSKFFDDFGSSTGLGWTSAPVTVSAAAGVVTMPASSAIARSFNPIIARSVGPWYMAGHLRLTSGLGGGGFWVVGLHDGGSNAVGVVADPAADATHWVFKIEKSGGSTSGTSTVVIGTDWHDFEAWYTGTGSVHFSVDNETTVDLANTNLTAVNMPAGMVASDADKAKCQLDKILYLTTLPS